MNKVKNVINIKYYDSPCGGMIIGAVGKGLCLCDWRENRHRLHNDNRVKCFFNAVYEEKDSRLLDDALRELDEYFAGRRREFDIPLCPAGTDFQLCVWQALTSIPYGETRSYMEIAEGLGNAKGVRAVAQAVGANQMSLFVPCHRVIGSNRSLTGFAGDLDAKRFLIDLEQKFCRK